MAPEECKCHSWEYVWYIETCNAETQPCGEAPFRKILATVPTNSFQICSEVKQKYLVARGAGATNWISPLERAFHIQQKHINAWNKNSRSMSSSNKKMWEVILTTSQTMWKTVGPGWLGTRVSIKATAGPGGWKLDCFQPPSAFVVIATTSNWKTKTAWGLTNDIQLDFLLTKINSGWNKLCRS